MLTLPSDAQQPTEANLTLCQAKWARTAQEVRQERNRINYLRGKKKRQGDWLSFEDAAELAELKDPVKRPKKKRGRAIGWKKKRSPADDAELVERPKKKRGPPVGWKKKSTPATTHPEPSQPSNLDLKPKTGDERDPDYLDEVQLVSVCLNLANRLATNECGERHTTYTSLPQARLSDHDREQYHKKMNWRRLVQKGIKQDAAASAKERSSEQRQHVPELTSSGSESLDEDWADSLLRTPESHAHDS